MIHKIDATDRKLGRLASEIAVLLRGKDNPSFRPHREPDVTVRVSNVSKMNMPVKKRKEKVYMHYSGYPGGLKSETMEHLIQKKGYVEVLKRAVYGMLPANKLRARIMKKLVVSE